VYIITSLIIGDAVHVQTCQRCCLAISAAQKIPEQPFRAKELNSTLSRDELRHSKQGLKCHEWLRVTTGHPVITAVSCIAPV